jgi:hypothetical protein
MKIERVAGGPFYEMGWQKGWEGLLAMPCDSFLNYAQTLSISLGPPAGVMQPFYATKRPDGLYELVDAALSTREMEPAKVQALMQLLWEDVTMFPVYYVPGRAAIPIYVHDMGFMTLPNVQAFTPEKGWLSKK